MCPTDGKIPKYLNEDLFRDALNDRFERSDVKIESLRLKLTSEGGENYCSDIYRANIQFTIDGNETKRIALIVKALKKGFVDEVPMPTKETDMYTQMIPQMEEVLGEKSSLTPTCFRATKDTYIFQDLGDLGYTVQDRLKGLNESQARVLFEKIAVFHAASMVVAAKHPEVIEKVGTSFFENGIDSIPLAADLVYGNLEHITELAKQWEGFEEIVLKLEKLRKTYSGKLSAMVNSKVTKFKVLNHGDLWVNNMMFKHVNDTCVDVKLIDLQASSYGSPGVDLHYFLVTSLKLEVALPKKYNLLRTYYKHLKTTLSRLGYAPIPSWDDLLHELRLTELYTLQAALIAIPLIFLEKDVSKGNDVSSLKDQDRMKKQRVHMYQSERTLSTTLYILDRLNDLGVLD